MRRSERRSSDPLKPRSGRVKSAAHIAAIMRATLAPLALLLAAAAIPAPGHPLRAAGRCSVVEGDKLPPETGGTDALCAAVQRAIATVAPNARYTVEIRVLSPSRLAAVLAVNGQTLPQQNFAITDSTLNRGAIERFASSLAAEVARHR